MNEIRLKAYAKINLGLDVLRRRSDGYHDLRMIMQTIGLHDRICLRETKTPGIRIKTNVSFLPEDQNNLACRAAKLLVDEFHIERGVFIDLDKHIPVAAGLAGGSTDAAAVLVGVNRIFHLGLNRSALMERAAGLGADVPYCVLRGSALAEGIGEVLTPLSAPPPCAIVLAKPDAHVSTRLVYERLKTDEITAHPAIDAQIEALKEGDLAALAGHMGNVLERVTIPLCPLIGTLKEEMLRLGAVGAMMSGSGPTVFGLFRDKNTAWETANRLRGMDGVRQVYVTGWSFQN